MPLEIILRETIVCATCKGDGDIYTPEFYPCPDCAGEGTYVGGRVVSLKELAQLLKEEGGESA